MNLYDNVMNRTTSYGTNIGALALALVMLIIVTNIIYRIFGGIISGSYELVEIIVVLVAAFALPNTEISQKHTTVDILTVHLSGRPKIWLDTLCNLISLVFWATISWGTLKLTMGRAALGEVTDTLKISIIPSRSIWTFGLILMFFVVVYKIYRNFKELKEI